MYMYVYHLEKVGESYLHGASCNMKSGKGFEFGISLTTESESLMFNSKSSSDQKEWYVTTSHFITKYHLVFNSNYLIISIMCYYMHMYVGLMHSQRK
jgi:hypothetical protein